jgi:nicotinamidase-related amidase
MTTTISSTQPYAWPWDAAFDPARLALVVTGVQRAHAEASLDVPTSIDRIEELSGAVRRAGGIVCHVRHTSPAQRPRPLLPEVGMEAWAPVLRPGPEDLLVAAAGHDGFFGSSLDQELRSRRRDLLVVVGLAAEVTVSCTVRSANDRGYECLTPIDVSAPLDAWTSEHELHSVTMSGGIFGAIGPVAPLLEALQQHRSGAAAAGPAPSNPAQPEPSIDHEPALEESA